MPFFENRNLTDSIKIKATPEKIFNFLTSIVDFSFRNSGKSAHLLKKSVNILIFFAQFDRLPRKD